MNPIDQAIADLQAAQTATEAAQSALTAAVATEQTKINALAAALYAANFTIPPA